MVRYIETAATNALTHKDSVWATLPLEIIGAFRNMIRSFWWNRGGTINSKEGVSCLLINTECGQHLVEKYGAKIESYPVEFSNIAQENTQLNRPTKHTRLRNKIFRKYKASGYAGVEAIFERDQRNQKFIWEMYGRICGMFCRKTR